MSEMTSNDNPPPATSEAALSAAASSSSNNNNNNKDYSEMKADEARIQAEARRKRILEKANKRMNVVSGELPTLNEQNDGDDDGDNKIGSASNAARIRAARARMYGKKSTTTTAGTGITATTIVSTSVTATGSTEENTNPKDSLPEDAPVETKEEDPAATVNKEELLTTISSADTTGSSAPFDEITEETLVAATTTTPLPEQPPMEKKKYVGVAKMRRKMIAKKKLEEEEQADNDVFTTITDVDAAVAANKIFVSKIPIYMHMVIVFLLFIAGLDVGIQQYHDDVTVHTQTAVQEYGLPFVHRKPWQPVNATQNTKLDLVEENLSASSTPGTNGPNGVVEDEFDDASGDDVEYVPNIDPLFRVDLDEFTKGPGILNQFARGAVTVHRFMLQLLYYMPMAFINTLLSIPMALIKVPPALFVIALILRQLVGKMILGAHIPDNKADQSGEQNNIEVISVAKNFVKNFFATNFPTLALAYDVFTHLRADMYIILCGVFCGMAWSHLTHSQDAIGSMGDTKAAPLDGFGQEL